MTLADHRLLDLQCGIFGDDEIIQHRRTNCRAAGLPKPGEIDFLPFGLNACRGALQTIIKYALQQRLIPRAVAVDELFDELTRSLR